MPSTLGTFIRRRRAHLGLTQLQLAERAGHGTRQEDISRLEQGRIALPRWGRLRALAAALEVTPGELLLRAGVIATTDLRGTSQHAVGPAPRAQGQPRGVIQPRIHLIGEWETAASFVG